MKIRRKRPEIVKTQTVAAAIRRKEWICLIIALLFAFPSSGNAQCEAKNDAFTVSYTHLTLPTIA